MVIHLLSVLLVNFVAAGADGLLEKVNRFWVEEVVFTIFAPLIHAAGVERLIIDFDVAVWECGAVADEGFLGDLREARAFTTGGGAGEILVHQIGIEANRFEDLCATVGGDSGDTHLGHRLDDAFDRSLDEVVNCLVELDVDHVIPNHLMQRFEGHVRG